MPLSKKKSKNKLFDIWKIDKSVFDQGQAPEWVNNLLEPDNFFTNKYGVIVVIHESIKFTQKSIPFQGNYLRIELDNKGNIPSIMKISAVSKESVE